MAQVRGRKVGFDDIDEDDLVVSTPKTAAAGREAVEVAFECGLKQGGASRAVRSKFRVNQPDGVDWPGCARPESITGDRKKIEFCENGAKALAEENTTRVATPGWWEQHPIAELEQRTNTGSVNRVGSPTQ